MGDQPVRDDPAVDRTGLRRGPCRQISCHVQCQSPQPRGPSRRRGPWAGPSSCIGIGRPQGIARSRARKCFRALASGRFGVFPGTLRLRGFAAFITDESGVHFSGEGASAWAAIAVPDAGICFVRFVRFFAHSLNVGRASDGVEVVPRPQFAGRSLTAAVERYGGAVTTFDCLPEHSPMVVLDRIRYAGDNPQSQSTA